MKSTYIGPIMLGIFAWRAWSMFQARAKVAPGAAARRDRQLADRNGGFLLGTFEAPETLVWGDAPEITPTDEPLAVVPGRWRVWSNAPRGSAATELFCAHVGADAVIPTQTPVEPAMQRHFADRVVLVDASARGGRAAELRALGGTRLVGNDGCTLALTQVGEIRLWRFPAEGPAQVLWFSAHVPAARTNS